jgi:hypothetical protein
METDGASALGRDHTVCQGGVQGVEYIGQDTLDKSGNVVGTLDKAGEVVGQSPTLCCLDGAVVGHPTQEDEVILPDVGKKGAGASSNVGLSKPKTIRSRKGDLYVVRPSDENVGMGVLKAKGPAIGGKAQRLEQKNKASSSKGSKSFTNSEAVSKNSVGNKGKQITQNLPFNMLRKLPGGLYQDVCRKKNSKGNGGGRCDGGSSEESDSIRISDISGPGQSKDGDGDGGVNVAMEGINLEVVLHGSVEDVPILARNAASGTNLILQSDCGEEFQSREVVEANKLRGIAEDMGMVFQGSEVVVLDRIVSLEDRDSKEKEGWELKRGNAGVQ